MLLVAVVKQKVTHREQESSLRRVFYLRTIDEITNLRHYIQRVIRFRREKLLVFTC
jgi:hypothetical protein